MFSKAHFTALLAIFNKYIKIAKGDEKAAYMFIIWLGMLDFSSLTSTDIDSKHFCCWLLLHEKNFSSFKICACIQDRSKQRRYFVNENLDYQWLIKGSGQSSEKLITTGCVIDIIVAWDNFTSKDRSWCGSKVKMNRLNETNYSDLSYTRANGWWWQWQFCPYKLIYIL